MMSRVIHWGAVILVGLAFAYGAWQMISAGRTAAGIERSRQNLKQIGLALHSYHEQYDCFPPAYVLGPDGKPWHSWRVLLLPFLGEKLLFEQYRFDEPWDGPHNQGLLQRRPNVFASPLQKSQHSDVATYLGVVSRRTMWPAHFSVKMGDVTDGTANTIFLVECQASNVRWSEPREMSEKDALAQLRPADKEESTAPPSPRIPILLVDGSVRMISPQINRDLFVSLLTPQYGAYMVADGWPREDRPRSELPRAVDISRFSGTRVFPVPEMDLAINSTSLYCATRVGLAAPRWAPLKELAGLGVPTSKKPIRFIADARQSVRFRLDEYGAELIADTQMVVGDNGDGALHINLLVPRRLIFDRPFLLALKERKAIRPYFLAWIGNADLMEAANRYPSELGDRFTSISPPRGNCLPWRHAVPRCAKKCVNHRP